MFIVFTHGHKQGAQSNMRGLLLPLSLACRPKCRKAGARGLEGAQSSDKCIDIVMERNLRFVLFLRGVYVCRCSTFTNPPLSFAHPAPHELRGFWMPQEMGRLQSSTRCLPAIKEELVRVPSHGHLGIPSPRRNGRDTAAPGMPCDSTPTLLGRNAQVEKKGNVARCADVLHTMVPAFVHSSTFIHHCVHDWKQKKGLLGSEHRGRLIHGNDRIGANHSGTSGASSCPS